MSNEDALQAYLDEHPDEHTVREVLADFLDEIGDPRGPGYRVLGVLGFYPVHLRPTSLPEHDHWMYQMLSNPVERSWRSHTFDVDDQAEHEWFRAFCPRCFGSHHPSRRAAEDAAALAFASLPESRQAELLTPAASPSHSAPG